MNLSLKDFKINPVFAAILLALIIYSTFIRVQDLGYSNFQGDEVNTVDFIYEMEPGINGFWNYLISQKRGPVQYVLNIMNVGVFGYISELQIRIPYLISGIVAIYTLYLLAKKIYDNETALMAATFMSINGLFIAFARITQYQSLMYCVIPVGVILFINALRNFENTKKFFYAGLLMSFSLLVHYDTLSVVPFFIIAFIGYYIRQIQHSDDEFSLGEFFSASKRDNGLLKKVLKRAGIFFLAFLLPALLYYIPFYFGKSFEDTTSDYLGNRLFGGGFMPRTQITSDLLTMYIPEFHLNFLFFAGILGVLFNFKGIRAFKLSKLNINTKLMQNIFIFFCLLIGAASIFSLYPIKPRSASLLVIGASIAVSVFLTAYKKVSWERAAVCTWFLGAYSFYFFVMKDPRTHVYVSMMPLFIISGYGIIELYKTVKVTLIKNLLMSVLIVSMVLVTGISTVIFVDKNPEYPWWDKDYMGWPIYRIERVRHQKIEGVFGFNNYRAWEEIADLRRRGCIVGTFNSNEKDSITYFYIREHQKKGSDWGFARDADNLILAEGPHSWEYFDEDYIPASHKLIHTIYSNDYIVNRIYGDAKLYPEGMKCSQE